MTGGGTAVEEGPYDAVVWSDARDGAGLRALLDEHPGIDWVQLPFAGIEPFVPYLDDDRTWTCGKGVYSDPVAEMVIGLALAGMRNIGAYARATEWTGPVGTNLYDARVTIVGGGGITDSLLDLLGPFRTTNTVVRRSPEVPSGAHRVITLDDLDGVLPATDLLVLAVSLTPETTGLLDERRLRLLRPSAWVVNVARGRHVVTDDMVRVLADGAIGGYATDVTDPEPLPPGHPLWHEPRCIITPHVGNTPEMAVPLLSARVTENVQRYVAGEPLIGLVDVDAGY